jgi:hypothetical protein
MDRKAVAFIIKHLVADGLVEHNGIYRLDSDGRPRPAYVSTERGRRIGRMWCGCGHGLMAHKHGGRAEIDRPAADVCYECACSRFQLDPNNGM